MEIQRIIDCPKEHPTIIVTAKIMDPYCIRCPSYDSCSSASQQRHIYKQMLKNAVTNEQKYTGEHICDWCGNKILKRGKLYHCSTCERDIEIDGIDQHTIL